VSNPQDGTLRRRRSRSLLDREQVHVDTLDSLVEDVAPKLQFFALFTPLECRPQPTQEIAHSSQPPYAAELFHIHTDGLAFLEGVPLSRRLLISLPQRPTFRIPSQENAGLALLLNPSLN
jgi:hypothetical protein